MAPPRTAYAIASPRTAYAIAVFAGAIAPRFSGAARAAKAPAVAAFAARVGAAFAEAASGDRHCLRLVRALGAAVLETAGQVVRDLWDGAVSPQAVAAACRAQARRPAGLLRDNVRRVFAEALRAGPGDTAGAAAALESAVFRRFGAAPRDYYRLGRRLRAVVAIPRGEFLETCFAADVAAGALPLDDLLEMAWARDGRYWEVQAPPTPRVEVCALFYRLLANFGPGRRQCALELERGCYNEVIAECGHEAVPCQWEVPEFRALYSARCGRVAAHIDRNGSIAGSVGEPPVLAQLASGAWRPGVVGALENDELCPAAHRAAKVTIRRRLDQVVRVRRSNLYECPKCHARDCEWKLVQMRSLDEPANVCCKCVCGEKFQGND